MHSNDWMWGMHWGWGVLWIVLTVALLLILAERLRHRSSGSVHYTPPPGADSDSPLEILKKRYARGDISDKEYQIAKQRLEED